MGNPNIFPAALQEGLRSSDRSEFEGKSAECNGNSMGKTSGSISAGNNGVKLLLPLGTNKKTFKINKKCLVQLPDKVNMTIDIVRKKYLMTNRYVESQRHTVQVDYVEYMDELATLAGVKPNLFKLFLSDPRLALHVFFGPCTPYQYRLSGPGKWSGAREAILTQWSRIIKPTQTRVLENTNVDRSIPLMLKVFAFFIVLAAFFLYL